MSALRLKSYRVIVSFRAPRERSLNITRNTEVLNFAVFYCTYAFDFWVVLENT